MLWVFFPSWHLQRSVSEPFFPFLLPCQPEKTRSQLFVKICVFRLWTSSISESNMLMRCQWEHHINRLIQRCRPRSQPCSNRDGTALKMHVNTKPLKMVNVLIRGLDPPDVSAVPTADLWPLTAPVREQREVVIPKRKHKSLKSSYTHTHTVTRHTTSVPVTHLWWEFFFDV